MIMVDELQNWPTKLRCFQKGSCHMTTDGDLEELHAFALRLGLRREWYQDHPIAKHYDLTPSKRERALAFGAVFVSAREQSRTRRAARTTEPITQAQAYPDWSRRYGGT